MASTETPEIVSAALSARIEALQSSYGGPPSLSQASDPSTTTSVTFVDSVGMPITPVLAPAVAHDFLTGVHLSNGLASSQALLASGVLTPNGATTRKRLAGSPPRDAHVTTYRRRAALGVRKQSAPTGPDVGASIEADLEQSDHEACPAPSTGRRVLRSNTTKARGEADASEREKETNHDMAATHGRGRKRVTPSQPPLSASEAVRASVDPAHPPVTAPPTANQPTILTIEQQIQLLEVLRGLTQGSSAAPHPVLHGLAAQAPHSASPVNNQARAGSLRQHLRQPPEPSPLLPGGIDTPDAGSHDQATNPTAQISGTFPHYPAIPAAVPAATHSGHMAADPLPFDPIVLDDEEDPAPPQHHISLSSSMPELSSLPPLPSENGLDSTRVRWTKEGYRQQFEEFEAVRLFVLHALRNLLPLCEESEHIAQQCRLLDKAAARCKSRMKYILVANAGGGYDVADLHRSMEAGDLAYDRMVVRAKAQAQALRAAKMPSRSPLTKAFVPRHDMKLQQRRPLAKGIICYACQEPGHMANACPKRQEQGEPSAIV